MITGAFVATFRRAGGCVVCGSSERRPRSVPSLGNAGNAVPVRIGRLDAACLIVASVGYARLAILGMKTAVAIHIAFCSDCVSHLSSRSATRRTGTVVHVIPVSRVGRARCPIRKSRTILITTGAQGIVGATSLRRIISALTTQITYLRVRFWTAIPYIAIAIVRKSSLG